MATTVTRPVGFGISLPNRAVLLGSPVDLLIDTATAAEDSGWFDSIWVGDNFLSKPRLEALITLAGIATRTKNVKLGTICLATFVKRHPVELAIQWASLDVLSGGRSVLAVCLGGSAKNGPKFATELRTFGINDQDRPARLVEGVKMLRLLWGSEPVTYKGRFYEIENVEALPKPAQAHLPILIATNPPADAPAAVEERALRRVARYADGWQTDSIPAALFASRWSRIREYAAEYGRADQMNHASLHLMININDDADFAYTESMDFLQKYYGLGRIPRERLESWFVYGSPQAVIEKIEGFLAAGCTMPVLRFTSADQMGQLERFVKDIAPAFKGRVTVGGAPISVSARR